MCWNATSKNHDIKHGCSCKNSYKPGHVLSNTNKQFASIELQVKQQVY